MNRYRFDSRGLVSLKDYGKSPLLDYVIARCLGQEATHSTACSVKDEEGAQKNDVSSGHAGIPPRLIRHKKLLDDWFAKSKDPKTKQLVQEALTNVPLKTLQSVEFVKKIAPTVSIRRLLKHCPDLLVNDNIRIMEMGVKWLNALCESPQTSSASKVGLSESLLIDKVYKAGSVIVRLEKIVCGECGWTQDEFQDVFGLCCSMFPNWFENACFSNDVIMVYIVGNYRFFFNRLAKCVACKHWDMEHDVVDFFELIVQEDENGFQDFVDHLDQFKEIVWSHVSRKINKKGGIKYFLNEWRSFREQGKTYEEFVEHFIRIVKKDG